MSVSTSTSTQHVPHDVEEETKLSAELRSWLAFADQKAVEVKTLAGLLTDPAAFQPAIDEASRVIASRAAAEGVRRADVRARTAALTAAEFTRPEYSVREAAQEETLQLAPLPTTTIGSFQQTSEIRSARARNIKGDLNDEQLMKDETKGVVDLQEELGYDVLVHGEPERNDMVQYFAENLEGFDVTRPRLGPVLRFALHAPLHPLGRRHPQRAHHRQMGRVRPVPDQPLAETANQVGLALRGEIADLEAARSRMEVVHDLESHGFGRGVGPGVYDIHSPRVPGEQKVTELLATAVKHVPSRQLWVNPDCGLKTRGYAETEESLRNLVKATQSVRAELLETAK